MIKEHLLKKFEFILNECKESDSPESQIIEQNKLKIFKKIINKSNLTKKEGYSLFGILKSIEKKL